MVNRTSALSTILGASAALLLAACGNSGGPTVGPGSSTPAPAPSSAPTSAPPATSSSPTSDAAIDFKPGLCLNDQPDWQTTPCDQMHFYEVTSVVKDSHYRSDLVKRSAYKTSVCDQSAAKYLDGPGYGSLLLGSAIPVAADPDHANQIVCVVSQQKGDDSGIRSMAGSVKGALKGKGFYKYQWCLSNKAGSKGQLKLTPCSDPHVSESTYGYINGKWGDKFPGEAKLNKTALNTCTKYGKKYLDGSRSDISFAQKSSGKSAWNKGHRLTVCFVQVDHGKVTKSLRGIGKKSLSSYR